MRLLINTGPVSLPPALPILEIFPLPSPTPEIPHSELSVFLCFINVCNYFSSRTLNRIPSVGGGGFQVAEFDFNIRLAVS